MSRFTVPRFFKRPIVLIAIVALGTLGAYYVSNRTGSADAAPAFGAGGPGGGGARGAQGGGGGGGGGGFGGFGGGGGGGGPRQPMTVELADVARGEVTNSIQVVGNLIGLQTVEATPKVAGRLQSVSVHMGDRVSKGQLIAKVEDLEINEQVKQAQAAYEVSAATVRQRQAGMVQAKNNIERSRSLFERQLIPKQTLDDSQASYDAAVAQLDLANAQASQSKARLDELNINLSNTVITSPLSGVVGRRLLDPGGWVTPQSTFVTVVDISAVRLVASIVEKDIRLIQTDMPVKVEVDAFPGETFKGRVAHVAPVLDPTTRTAQIEVEIANPQYRLKPGMYAKVYLTTERHSNILVVPTAALVDQGDQRGVFLAESGQRGNVARFRPVQVGLMDQSLVEITGGLQEGETVVTTGAAGLREGDQVLLAGQAQGQGGQGGGQGGQGGRGQGQGRGQGGGQAGQQGGQGRGGQGQGAPGAGGQNGQGRQPGANGGRGPGQGGQGGQQRPNPANGTEALNSGPSAAPEAPAGAQTPVPGQNGPRGQRRNPTR